LFLDPDPRQIEEAARLKVDAVELHTGRYANASDYPHLHPEKDRAAPDDAVEKELANLQKTGAMIRQAGMTLHAGHGLTYRNVRPIATIEGMHELNIGHSIVARAMMVGFEKAVREMKELVAGG
jgi:pyridoxine 5-phosphate synthase